MDGLWQYTQAFEVVVQVAPAPAVVLYGGARLLQLAQQVHNCFSRVLDIVMPENMVANSLRITNTLQRCLT